MMYLKTSLRSKKNIQLVHKMIVAWLVLIIGFYLYEMINVSQNQSVMLFFLPIIFVFFIIESVLLILEYICYHKKQIGMTLMSGAFLTLITVVEIVHYYVYYHFHGWIFLLGLCIYAMLQMYLFVRRTREREVRAELAKKLENEVVQSRIAVTLGQIQPHFLYNALATIRSLCVCNPEVASTAIEYFSTYLRSNMEFLSAPECISFEKELSHVKSYLYIEQLRFADRLEVQYEIKVSDFRCPPLVLQTIVENSVKHGICNKIEGGKLVIQTFESDKAYYIVVLDDGIGFNPKEVAKDGRIHLGIENTRCRLKDMCNGRITIESKPEIGTSVTIIIPKM